jgi:hypothetical protein
MLRRGRIERIDAETVEIELDLLHCQLLERDVAGPPVPPLPHMH